MKTQTQPASPLSESEVLALRLRTHSQRLEKLVADIQAYSQKEALACVDTDINVRCQAIAKTDDMHEWIGEGKMELRKGIMCLQRALYDHIYF